jgi:hypothetical protein
MKYRDEIKKLHLKEGMKGFTRGYTGILIRDAPGYGLYFMFYDLFKRFLNVEQDKEK